MERAFPVQTTLRQGMWVKIAPPCAPATGTARGRPIGQRGQPQRESPGLGSRTPPRRSGVLDGVLLLVCLIRILLLLGVGALAAVRAAGALREGDPATQRGTLSQKLSNRAIPGTIVLGDCDTFQVTAWSSAYVNPQRRMLEPDCILPADATPVRQEGVLHPKCPTCARRHPWPFARSRPSSQQFCPRPWRPCPWWRARRDRSAPPACGSRAPTQLRMRMPQSPAVPSQTGSGKASRCARTANILAFCLLTLLWLGAATPACSKEPWGDGTGSTVA